MPRPTTPPTPQLSTEIPAKSSADAPQLEDGLNLPPAALSSRASASSSSEVSENASDSSYHPPSPVSSCPKLKPAHVRKRLNGHVQPSASTIDDYPLPPPPTRSRKIIQMNPKDAQDAPRTQQLDQNTTATTGPALAGTKRKQPSNAATAGRKIARKTAHSLIERRRRSKMNEEFGVLKDMIPACRGQEMHKLAILQASIEYMRYLERCIGDLQSAHRSQLDSPLPSMPKPIVQRADESEHEPEELSDEEMEDVRSPQLLPKISSEPVQFINTTPAQRSAEGTSALPAILTQARSHHTMNTSPALHPMDSRSHMLASSSVPLALTSPPMQSSPIFNASPPSAPPFSNTLKTRAPEVGSVVAPGSAYQIMTPALISPALGPSTDREDQEATEALMMLNTDRRSWSSGRSMSVRDLLSG